MITLLHPIWLVFAIPLLALWWLWRPSSKTLHFIRLAIILLALPALCGLAVRLPSRNGTVVIIADRSDSMPPGSETAQKEIVELIQRGMGANDRLAIVSVGHQAVIERSPQAGAFPGFTAQIDKDGSNISEAIEKAVALIPQDAPGKMLIVSDGRWTGRDPLSVASRAATRGIAIDYRSLQRTTANDLAIAQIDAPVSVTPGEAFMLTAWLKSPIQQEISYELQRSGRVMAAGKTQLTSGLNRLTFRDSAGDPGAQIYRLKITGNGDDPVPENNSAKILVGVKGPKPLLLVADSQMSGLSRSLASGGMQVKNFPPDAVEWSLDSLSQFSGVLIENVNAQKIGERGMEIISSWVTEAGAGLMMTGGKNSYGPGGYFKSPLEPILPVSMELRREHRKLALAIVVAMDRSGSMAVSVPGGRTKMDLANLAAVQVLDMLTPIDEYGVIAVDSSSHIIADLDSVEVNSKLRDKILQVDSGGGGIFIFEALASAADMILKAKSGTRHIILFADAADSEEPGKYQELLRQCQDSGVTVSVIGLGQPTDVDADLLRDIAKRGNGQIYFTENAAELPRLFAQDTIVVARSAFIENSTPVKFTPGMITLTGRQFKNTLSIGGYNLTYIRPKANLAAMSEDEYQAPVTASWQAGGGRVVCYTGEADGKFAGGITGWEDTGAFFSSLARWASGESNNLPGNMIITQEVKNGTSIIELHLDPERNDRTKGSITPDTIPIVTTLRGSTGAKPVSEKAEMRWTSADTLRLEIPLRGNDTALSTIEIAGVGKLTLAPVVLPYSPEFRPAAPDEGRATLARLAQATGGKERVDLSGVWKDLPRLPRMTDLAPWLLLTALSLLMIEIFARQTGMPGSRKIEVEKKKPAPKPVEVVNEQQPEPENILDALEKAGRRMKERTRNTH